MDLLITRNDWYDCGFSWGVWGDHTTGQMMTALRRELGTLADWQIDALCRGFAAGQKERAEFERDQARAEPAACEAPW